MNMEASGNRQESFEARALTDAELDTVNGGFFFIVAGLIAAFEVGFIAGEIAANYSMTGNMMGNIRYRH